MPPSLYSQRWEGGELLRSLHSLATCTGRAVSSGGTKSGQESRTWSLAPSTSMQCFRVRASLPAWRPVQRQGAGLSVSPCTLPVLSPGEQRATRPSPRLCLPRGVSCTQPASAGTRLGPGPSGRDRSARVLLLPPGLLESSPCPSHAAVPVDNTVNREGEAIEGVCYHQKGVVPHREELPVQGTGE